MIAQDKMTLQFEDSVGQTYRRVHGIPQELTVGEMLSNVSRQMHLPDQDGHGRPLIYGASTDDGDVLNLSDRVGDVLTDNQRVTLTRSVTAGQHRQ